MGPDFEYVVLGGRMKNARAKLWEDTHAKEDGCNSLGGSFHTLQGSPYLAYEEEGGGVAVVTDA